MKLKLLIQASLAGIILLTLSTAANAQGYVEQDVIKIPGIMTEAATAGLPVSQMSTTRMYYDGLGRPLQTVAKQASPGGNDMIQPVAYNPLGQQTITYLPYTGTTTDASYHSSAIATEQPAFYNQTSQYLIPVDAAPYSQIVLENSPLQRLLESGMTGAGFQPGASGTQHYKTVSYRSNTGTLDGSIIMWNPDGTKNASNYADNTLSVTDGTDEDGVETRSYADYAGRTILKRQVVNPATPTYYDTYYVYNNAGMVSIIISPKALSVAAANSYNLGVTAVKNLLFQYSYDSQGRVVTKTVSSKGNLTIIYDPLNRPVLMQDANMAAAHQWNYIKYDVKGRAISQGIYTDTGHDATNMQSYVDGLTVYNTYWYETRDGSGAGYYTNNTFPNTGISALAYSYFDNYDLNNDGANDYSYHATGLPNEVGATTAPTKDMPTMTLTGTVGTGMTAKWLIKVIFYDHNLHPIQTQSNNLVNYGANYAVTDYTTTVPDFMGQTTVSQTVKNVGTTTTVQTTPHYDPQYRVLAIDQQLNNSKLTRRIANYTYSEAGQMIQKGLAVNSATTDLTLDGTNSVPSGTGSLQTATNSITMTPGFTAYAGSTFVAQIAPAYLQQLDYRYNIRGQLLNINNSRLTADGGQTEESNNSVFGMQLLYNGTDANLSTTPYYNGKLSAVKWMTKDGSGTNGMERAFVYSYDATDRYTQAAYAERGTGGSTPFSANNNWTEAITGYDENGNINGLTRNASTAGSGTSTPIDNLTYTYRSDNANQLDHVTDATGNPTGFGIYTGGNVGGSYTYDANGNLISDPFKNISTSFNILNKTDVITMNAVTGQTIAYIYDATGSMIRKIANSGTAITTTDYIDGFVYVNSTLSYFPMPEGRMVNESGHLKPQYVVTDQQGNARITMDDSGTGHTAKVLQENSYYGFGMVMPGSAVSLPTPPNKNLYNGQSEIQNDFNNLPDLMQTFYRNYDAALGRWTGVDPDADNTTESFSTYHYADNNPINWNDPLGSKANESQQMAIDPNAAANAFIQEGIAQAQAWNDAYNNWFDQGAPSGGGGSFNVDVSNVGNNTDPIAIWGDQHVQAAHIANYIDNSGGGIPGFGGSTINGVLSAMNNSTSSGGFDLDWNTGNIGDDKGSLSRHEFISFTNSGPGPKMDSYSFFKTLEEATGNVDKGTVALSTAAKIAKATKIISKAAPYIEATSKSLGKIGRFEAPLSVGVNIYELNRGEIGWGRFGFRSTGTAVAFGVGEFVGPEGGFVTSGGFWAAEQSYNGVVWFWSQFTQSIGQINSALGSGWLPGR